MEINLIELEEEIFTLVEEFYEGDFPNAERVACALNKLAYHAGWQKEELYYTTNMKNRLIYGT